MVFNAIRLPYPRSPSVERGKTYICPECGGSIRLRGGKRRRLHFYHLKNRAFCRHDGKTIQHQRLQKFLSRLLNAQMEKPFPQIGRIADLYCAQKNLVIEVQISPLSSHEIFSRNRDYNSCGLRVFWIFMESRFVDKRFLFDHAFTDGFDIYALWRKKRFPIDLSSELPLPQKRRLPYTLRKREMSFKGDLIQQTLMGSLPQKKISVRRFLMRALWTLAE